MTDRERLIELLNKVGENVLKFPTDNFIESLADYLLSNGVIVPPCKVGDTIYIIVEQPAHSQRKYFRFIKKTILTYQNLERVLRDIGKTVFLTKEEAEKALEEMSK